MSDRLLKESDVLRIAFQLPLVVNSAFDDAVKALPSADRPQGEWIESFKKVEVKRGAYLGTKFVHDGWSCSECSEVVEKRYPNCPYCLARMKGAEH